MNVRIRLLREEEQKAARQLLLDGLGEHFGRVDESCNRDLEDIVATYLTHGHPFLVAEADAMLIGTGGMVIENENTGQIVRVSVARAFRRRGIGSALVRHLLSIADRRGLTRVWVETNDDWMEAIQLYVRCGFQEFARVAGCAYLELDLPRNPVGPTAY